jgi:hypothetical protein
MPVNMHQIANEVSEATPLLGLNTDQEKVAFAREFFQDEPGMLIAVNQYERNLRHKELMYIRELNLLEPWNLRGAIGSYDNPLKKGYIR